VGSGVRLGENPFGLVAQAAFGRPVWRRAERHLHIGPDERMDHLQWSLAQDSFSDRQVNGGQARGGTVDANDHRPSQ
jgi:hypothetical protein